MTENEVRVSAPDVYPDAYRAAIEEERGRVADSHLGRGQSRRVLVVGGGGYIGAPLCQHLLAGGYLVRSLDAFVYRHNAATFSLAGQAGYEFVYGDHGDKEILNAALAEVTDVIILSGLVGDPITKKYPDQAQRINLDSMTALVRNLNGRGLNKLIFVSTCSNYGLIPEGDLADESYELKPLSLYAQAKVAIEKELLSSKGSTDFRPTVLRFATAFGLSSRMRFDLTISEFTRELFVGNELLVYDADTWRPYCHVKDFCDVVSRVLEAPTAVVSHEVFNAGGDINNFTKRMIVDTILDFLPDRPVVYQEHGGDPRNYRVDFSKIRAALHFEPSMTVRDGVAELVDALSQRLFDNVELQPNFFGNYEIFMDMDA